MLIPCVASATPIHSYSTRSCQEADELVQSSGSGGGTARASVRNPAVWGDKRWMLSCLNEAPASEAPWLVAKYAAKLPKLTCLQTQSGRGPVVSPGWLRGAWTSPWWPGAVP